MVDLIAPILRGLEGLKSSHPNVEIIYKDLGAKKIGERLDELNNLALTIGFQGATALTMYPNGEINVATVAMFNEFGTSKMPARSFMRRSVAENKDAIAAAAAFAFKSVVELKATPIAAMGALGRFMAEKMADAIDTAPVWAAPLAASTIESKGHADPLFDTGLMKKSITWAVRRGGTMGPVVREGKVS